MSSMKEEGDVGRPEELIINRYAKLRTAAGNIASGLGVLALLWSTVVLLGGFVGNLLVKEFWYLTVLSFTLASRMVDIADNEITKDIYMQEANIIRILGRQKWIPARKARFYQILLGMVLVPKVILSFCGGLFIQHSPPIILLVSVCRLLEQDYAISGEDIVNRAKLKAALNIFYALVAFQSLVAIYWFALWIKLDFSVKQVSSLTVEQGGEEKWGAVVVRMYYSETASRLKDGKLPGNWNLITFGVGLLQSPFGDDHLWGARVLDKLFDKDTSVRRELLSSRLSVQNLIGMIGWRGTDDNIENRERAARIVAHVASDLHITHFSGTLQSICSLLESCKQSCEPQITCRSGNPDDQRLPDKQDQHGSLETSKNQDDAHMVVPIKDQTGDEHEHHANSPSARFAKKKRIGLRDRMKKLHEMMGFSNPKYRYPYKSRGTKELISQGLIILEGLTQDEVNCIEICKDQRLISKITAQLSRHDFLSYVLECRMVEMMSRSLTVVSRLLTSPGDAATSLRQELASNTEAVSNLMVILETDSKGAQKLHEQAIETLTELAFFDDSSQKLDFNKLFKVLLRIFLEKETKNTTLQEPNNATIQEPNNATSQVEQANKERATRMRGKVGEALARMLPVRAARGILSEQVAINLSTMVLDQILSSEMGTPQVNNENQSKQTKFIAAMLSLTMVMCDENENSKEYFARPTPKDTDLVKKLKEILEANKRRSAECWRIVNLICQVVIAMIKVKPCCIKQFNEYNFVEALTEALETMSEIDDCMLFAGNDREVIGPARTLASLVKEAQELLQTA